MQPALRTAFRLDPRAQSIVTETGGKFVATCKSPGHGSSPSAFCFDETHELLDNSIISTLRLGAGARRQPLGIFSSTAGSNCSGPCFDMVEESKKILEGTIDRPAFFPLIYGIDADIDPFSEEALLMASPNAGLSISMGSCRPSNATRRKMRGSRMRSSTDVFS